MQRYSLIILLLIFCGTVLFTGCTRKLIGKWKPISARSGPNINALESGNNDGVTVTKEGRNFKIVGQDGQVFQGTAKGGVVEFVMKNEGLKGEMQMHPDGSGHMCIRIRDLNPNPMIPGPLQSNILITYERVKK